MSRRFGASGNILLERVKAAGHDVDEADFNDAITQNLRRGRFLLLIVGDGIREGVEAIAEYLHEHAGLHFSLGLVELPIYLMENGERLVVPRILARTLVVSREVVALPNGFEIASDGNKVGLWLVSNKQTIGDQALQRVALDWEEVRSLLGGQPELREWRGDPNRKWVAEEVPAAPFGTAEQRQEASAWLRERLNNWISVFRPRIRSAVADIEREQI